MDTDFPGLPLVGGQDAALVAALPAPPVAAPSTALVPVCFLRSALPYNPGDIAGFPPTYAEALIAAKVAEAVPAGDAPAAAPPNPDPAPKPGGKGRAAKSAGDAPPPGDADNL